ncbi:MAG: hypothetical protein ABR616_15645 [Dermatophilaceae bacterium]
MTSPTPLAEVRKWQVGTRVTVADPRTTMQGTFVQLIDPRGISIPVAVVDWDSGHQGRHTATTLKEVSA